MKCGSEVERNLGKTYFLVGSVFTVVIILSAADIFGRKKGFYGTFIVIVVGMTLSILISNFQVRMAFLGIAYSSCPLYSALYTIYFQETIRKLR